MEKALLSVKRLMITGKHFKNLMTSVHAGHIIFISKDLTLESF